MKLFIAVTDNDWYAFLRERPNRDEANFWRPSGRSFSALTLGEPLLFKLHSPYHRFIAGGGFLAHVSQLPYRTAWEFFGESNGAPSLAEMRARIFKYRRGSPDPHDDHLIGCVILTDLFFFDRETWIQVPDSFSSNTQVGKTYDTGQPDGARLWQQVRMRLRGQAIGERPTPPAIPSDLYPEPVPTRRRLGQGAFRSLITDVYERRCAVSSERALPALEAAHIRPVNEGGEHYVENGLLLRADIHRLFDRGYVTVDSSNRFRVSRRLKDDFDNGEPYYPLAGSQIWQPRSVDLRPSREFLEWHADTVFRG